MKSIITTLLALSSILFSNAQEVLSDQQLNSELTLEEIRDKIATLEKQENKTLNAIEQKMSEQDMLKTSIIENENAQIESAEKKSQVIASMNGLSLSELNAEVRELEKTNARQKKSYTKNTSLIEKKKAQIEKLNAEIIELEGSNEDLEPKISDTQTELDEAKNTIKDNELVIKQTEADALEKKGQKLLKDKKRLEQKLNKTELSLAEYKSNLGSTQELIIQLKDQENQVISRTPKSGVKD